MIRKFAGHDTETPPGTVNLDEFWRLIEEGERVEKPRLTFEQWYAANEIHTYDKTEYECMKMAWNAAKENV